MSSSISSSTPNFDKLSVSNYVTWSGEMQAWLQACGLWRIVNGSKTCPTVSSPPTQAQSEAVEAWETKAEKAASYIYLMVEQDQRVHFGTTRDDPVVMWKALKDIHLQKCPGM